MRIILLSMLSMKAQINSLKGGFDFYNKYLLFLSCCISRGVICPWALRLSSLKYKDLNHFVKIFEMIPPYSLLSIMTAPQFMKCSLVNSHFERLAKVSCICLEIYRITKTFRLKCNVGTLLTIKLFAIGI